MTTSITNKTIWVTGGTGMVGKSLIKKLKKFNCNILNPKRKELDLLDSYQVSKYLEKKKPAIVFMTAAKVGGIFANNQYPASFI